MDPQKRTNLDDQLKEAAFICDFVRVRELIRLGVNVNVRDEEMRTPLHQAVLGDSLGLVCLVLESGADVNARDQAGFSPLHYAAQEFLPEIARILVGKGANVNLPDEDGNTPLHRALFSARGRMEIVRLLLENSANENYKNHAGVTPQELAAELGIQATNQKTTGL
jgi:ankyrin repeat protein